MVSKHKAKGYWGICITKTNILAPEKSFGSTIFNINDVIMSIISLEIAICLFKLRLIYSHLQINISALSLLVMLTYHKAIMMSFLLITLTSSQSCPGFYGGDLIQSGKHALINPLGDEFSFTYETQVFFDIPSTGLQIAVTSSTIGNYNPLPDWGFNYYIYGERKGDRNVIFDLTIRSDNSWQSIQLGYLFSGRTDMAIGNFESEVSQFQDLGAGLFKATNKIQDVLPDADYLVATFISGFSLYVRQFDLGINQHYYNKDSRELGVVFYCTKSSSILSIIFSYVIFPQSHPVFIFAYSQFITGKGSYSLSGPTDIKGNSVSYEEWRIQNRNLDCAASTCSSSCVRTEECVQQYGNVYEGRCIYCAPGVVFNRGICTRSCGENQVYIRALARRGVPCRCIDGYERVGLDCVKINQCGPNQNDVSGQCVCNPGYALWQDVCRKCPSSQSSVDGKTCICSDDEFYKPIENICVKKCKSTQHWVTDRCVCIDNYITVGDGCRKCPTNSQASVDKTTCVCNHPQHIYYFGDNVCQSCPSGQFPNSERTKCLCPANTLDQNGVCVPNCPGKKVYVQADSTCVCPFDHILLGDICVERCGLNQQFDQQADICRCVAGYARFSGPCKQCPVGRSTVSQDQKWCICNQPRQVFNPSRLICEPCPANSFPNSDKTECVCNPGYIEKAGVCEREIQCPARAEFNQQTLSCQCTVVDQYLINGVCRTCGSNEGWDGQKCICIDDHYRIEGTCRTCDPRSTYNGEDCICNIGYYGNRDLCEPCHISCSKCSGPQASQCLACADITLTLTNGFCSQQNVCPIGSFLAGGECIECLPYCRQCTSDLDCTQCAPGFEKDSFTFGGQTITSCIEVCGDGRRFEQDCDDDNTENGDGCSQNCQTEFGWTCTGGTTIQKDTCEQFVPGNSNIIQKEAVNTGTKIIQSLRVDYLPSCITENECADCFRALDVRVIQSFVPVKVSVSFVPASKYQFYVEYDFQGTFVTSAIRVAIRLNRDFYSCFSSDDYNQVLDVTIDPATLIICDQVGPLSLDQLQDFNQEQINSCNQA